MLVADSPWCPAPGPTCFRSDRKLLKSGVMPLAIDTEEISDIQRQRSTGGSGVPASELDSNKLPSKDKS